jgi:hypothetical protein
MKYLENYKEYKEEEYLFMANQARANIIGKGDINITKPDGETLWIRNVLYVPEVRKNLIAINQMDK